MAYTTSTAWHDWTYSTASSTATCDTTTSTWYYWTSDSTASTATTNTVTIVWQDWTGEYQYGHADVSYIGQPRETEEQRNARIASERQAREQYEREAKERMERQRKVEATARDLLRELLTEEQNEQLDKKGYFELRLANGNVYHIHKGYSGNVKRISQCGRVIESLCFHPRESLPDYDVMAMQKLMLEVDEAAARNAANVRNLQ